jgi:LysR family transcriptional regulator for metE and metH
VKRIPPSLRPKLEIRDLEVVLALSSAGSTARAAEALHVTQSAVSRALRQAEDKLGVQLFERGPRGLELTAAGDRLVRGASAVLAQLVDLETTVAAPLPGPVTVRLVCECYTAYRWLPSTLIKLRTTLPLLNISLAIDHTGDPLSALLAREVDIALLMSTTPVSGDLEEMPLFSDEIVFVMSPTHPLADRNALTADELRTHTVIVSTTTSATERRWFLSRVFGHEKPRLPFLSLPLTEAMIDAARAGMGVAILSEWITSPYLGGGDLLVKRFVHGPLTRPWRLAFRPEARAIAQKLGAALEGAAPRFVRSVA